MLSSSFGHQVLSIVPHVFPRWYTTQGSVMCECSLLQTNDVVFTLYSPLYPMFSLVVNCPRTCFVHFTPTHHVLSTLLHVSQDGKLPNLVPCNTSYVSHCPIVSHGQDSRVDVLWASWYTTIWLSKGEVRRRITLNIQSNMAHNIHHRPIIMFLKILGDN